MTNDIKSKKTSEKASHVHEPLFHVVKRDTIPWWKSWVIRISAIVIALLVCGLITLLVVKRNPLEMYIAMFKGSFGSKRKMWKLAKDIAVLLCISLAVTPAFRMKFWNTGAEGQVLVGCLATTACMYYMGGHAPDWMIIICMLAAAVLAGGIWGVIPAIFKAKFNTNETLFTLMMNYVATYLVGFFLIVWTTSDSNALGAGASSLGRLEHGHLPVLFGNDYVLILIVAALLTVGMFVYLRYSKQGYEISVVGESERTARYIGIKVEKVVIRTMLISGGLCGLAGLLLVGGSNNTARYIGISVPKVIIRTMIVSGALCGLAGFLIVGGLDHTVTTESAGGQGFTAIMVSWLGKFNPFYMIMTSFLVVFLDQGAAQVSQNFNIRGAFPDIVTGIILFFIIGCEFFINYKIVFRHKKAVQEAKGEQDPPVSVQTEENPQNEEVQA